MVPAYLPYEPSAEGSFPCCGRCLRARPSSFIRKDVALALQFPEDPETNALVESFIDSMRTGME